MPSGGRISVLTEAEARAIHEDRRAYRDIGITYGVSAQTVSLIKRGKTWKHLKLGVTTRGRIYKEYPRDEQTS